jgi:hypothetical protein
MKKHAILISALILSAASWGAGPKTRLLDHSNGALISEADAKALMSEVIPAKVWAIYPASKYVIVSQVEGGVTPAGICVVTARVMLLPLTPTMKAVLFRPQKTATAFDAKAVSTRDECRSVAHDELKQATEAIVSDLVKM